MTEMEQLPLGTWGESFPAKALRIYPRWLEQSEPGPGGSPMAGVGKEPTSISVELVRPCE